MKEDDFKEKTTAASIEYTRVALGCTLPPVWLGPTGVYLIKFLIGNLSNSPCNEPSLTVLFLDVTYTMYTASPPPFLTQVTPLYHSILLFLHGAEEKVYSLGEDLLYRNILTLW